MTLYEALLVLCPELTPDDFALGGTISLQNDGDGDYIKDWRSAVARPTDDAIALALPLPKPPTPAEISAECRRRIYAKASDNAQKNMTANFVAGNLSVADQQAYKDGVAWILQMQQAARDMVAAQDADFLLDEKWPACPAASAALAARF